MAAEAQRFGAFVMAQLQARMQVGMDPNQKDFFYHLQNGKDLETGGGLSMLQTCEEFASLQFAGMYPEPIWLLILRKLRVERTSRCRYHRHQPSNDLLLPHTQPLNLASTNHRNPLQIRTRRSNPHRSPPKILRIPTRSNERIPAPAIFSRA